MAELTTFLIFISVLECRPLSRAAKQRPRRLACLRCQLRKNEMTKPKQSVIKRQLPPQIAAFSIHRPITAVYRVYGRARRFIA
jgi:hypothetical protein